MCQRVALCFAPPPHSAIPPILGSAPVLSAGEYQRVESRTQTPVGPFLKAPNARHHPHFSSSFAPFSPRFFASMAFSEVHPFGGVCCSASGPACDSAIENTKQRGGSRARDALLRSCASTKS